MLSDDVLDLSEKNGRILLVDDDEAVLQALRRLFVRQYDVEVFTSPKMALEFLAQRGADVIISDMRMPEMDGAEFLKRCYEHNPDSIRILLTGYADLDAAVKAVNEGRIYRYLNKPWDNDELRGVVVEALDMRDLRATNQTLNDRVAVQNAELSRLNQELKEQFQLKSAEAGDAGQRLQEAYHTLQHEFNSMLLLLVRIMEARNGEDTGSSERQARLAKVTGEFAGLEGEQIQSLYYAALLRNLGKVLLPDSILNKSVRQMSPGEKVQYTRFPVLGQQALMMLDPLQRAAAIIRNHMELYNGKGFPDRLSGEAIPVESRILRLVSDYSDLQQPYNFLDERLSDEQARGYLLNMAGQRYDQDLVEVFMNALDDFADTVVSSIEHCELADAHEGMVLAANLVSPAGVILLSEGTQLTEHHVAKLQTLLTQFEGHDLRLHIRRSCALPDQSGSSS